MALAQDALTRMRTAVERAQATPGQVRREALAVLSDATSAEEPSELEATAAWAIGLAAREMNDMDAAEVFLERALRAATAVGAATLAARIRVSRALVLAYRGHDEQAIVELGAAESTLTGVDQAHARLQLGLVHQRASRLEEALRLYEVALPAFQLAGDLVGELRTRINAGVARTYLGEFDTAERELVGARALAVRGGHQMLAAGCAHNLGFLHGRRGNLPQALGYLETTLVESEGLGAEAGMHAVVLADRAELLAAAGLAGDALADLLSARGLIEASGNQVELAECNLLLARVSLVAGDGRLAATAATEAAGGFRRQGREPWATLADAVLFQARIDPPAILPAMPQAGDSADQEEAAKTATSLAESLERAGWRVDSLLMRALAGRLFLAAGHPSRAVDECTAVAVCRGPGPAATRLLGWQAETVRRLALGDRAGARRAIRAGLRIVEQHRMTLAAADLRATAASTADELARWLTALALDGRRPRDVLSAAEAWRAGSLVAPVSAPPDAELERLLGRLRTFGIGQRLADEAARDHERARLEAAVRDRARQLPASGARSNTKTFVASELVERVGDRMLLEFIESQGELFVVSVSNGVARLRELGQSRAIEAEARAARGCLQRLATASGSLRALSSAADTLTIAMRRLAEQLLGPVEIDGQAQVVIVPTGILYGVPWSALPGLAETPFVVAPSARAWMAADATASNRDLRRGKVLLAAGPGLDGGRREVEGISELHHRTICLTDEGASVDAVLVHLSTAAIAHFAAHGTFRTDNPLLSSLQFADGNLTVYDMERVAQIPATVVLSACDAAAARVHAGDELLGFSGTLLGMGASAVVAPMLPVADDATAELVIEFHRELVADAPAALALQRARCRVLVADGPEVDRYQRLAAAGTFIVMGA